MFRASRLRPLRTSRGRLPWLSCPKPIVLPKEALIRLRDVTREPDAERRRRIADRGKDVQALEELQIELDSANVELTGGDTQIEDLKLQIEDALDVEETFVQLTGAICCWERRSRRCDW